MGWGVCGWPRAQVCRMGSGWEGVLGWYPVQSWVFSVLKTPSSHHGPQSLPPHFLLLSPSLASVQPHWPLLFFNSRLTPSSRSWTFLFSVPGILSPPCPLSLICHSLTALPGPPSSLCPQTLSFTVVFSPALTPYSVLTLWVFSLSH